MTTRVDTEDIASTKSEKFLAVVLTLFMLIGTGWTYYKIGDWIGPDPWSTSASDQRIYDRQIRANQDFWDATDARDTASTDLEIARSDLQLAISQEKPTEDLQESYEQAQRTYEQAKTEYAVTKKKSDAADQAVEQLESDRSSTRSTAADWVVAGLRLALVTALTAGGFWLMRRLRERESRYLPLGFSVAATGTVMALWFAGDYITDYIDFMDLGPIVLSILGAGATLLAFAALQKYLTRRIPRSRVRKGECPFCAFPVRGDGPHCEGCGRDVVATCAACGSPRRVGTPHCAHCGAA